MLANLSACSVSKLMLIAVRPESRSLCMVPLRRALGPPRFTALVVMPT